MSTILSLNSYNCIVPFARNYRCREQKRKENLSENLRRHSSGYPAVDKPIKSPNRKGVSPGGSVAGCKCTESWIRSSRLLIHERTLRSFLFFPPIYRQDILETPLNRRPTFRENASPPFPSIIAGFMGMQELFRSARFYVKSSLKVRSFIYWNIFTFAKYIIRKYETIYFKT